MKVVIFGTGNYYEKYKDEIRSHADVVALLDNDPHLQGQYLDGVKIYKPKEVQSIEYDKIVLLSARAYEMKEQLIEIGVESTDILYKEEFYRETGGLIPKIYGNVLHEFDEKQVAIISIDMGYDGGTMAAIYAAKALQTKGHTICFIAPRGNELLINNLVNKSISVYIYSALPYMNINEIECINLCSAVLVNTALMIKCACEISKIKPVVWWLHESSGKYSGVYPNIIKQFSTYTKRDALKKIKIVAVSNIARNNFNYHFPNRIEEMMPYGIPDERGTIECKKKEKLVFAIIGVLSECKGSDIFIKAIGKLSEEERKQSEFWIIGNCTDRSVLKNVKNLLDKYSQIKLLGEKNREEMRKLFSCIDVVVSASREDCLPIVITEGMMYEKACITTDATGSSVYIKHEKNGLVCKSNDANDLAEKMSWVISHKSKLSEIGKNAREVYEQYFTIEKFAERLDYFIQLAKEEYINDSNSIN